LVLNVKNTRPGKNPRNYLSRREQWRLLLLVVGLGLVVMTMFEAREADNWRWIWRLDRNRAEDAEPVDTRLRPKAKGEEIADSFISRPDPEVDADDEAAEPARRYFPGVKRTYLDTIEDNTILRAAEKDAWFHLLALLEKHDEETLREASVGRVSFVQLYQQSDEYRGELVTLRGTLRRAHRLTAPENQYGIDDYYQVWLQPVDNAANPMVLYVLDLPEGFPTGMDIAEEAEVTGFYFKRWAYPAQDTVRLAPVVLAKGVQWFPSVSLAERTRSRQLPVWVVLVSAVLIASVLIGFVVFRTRYRPVAAEPPSDFEPFDPGAVETREDASATGSRPTDTGFPETDSESWYRED
jgi:hypothetical protein